MLVRDIGWALTVSAVRRHEASAARGPLFRPETTRCACTTSERRVFTCQAENAAAVNE